MTTRRRLALAASLMLVGSQQTARAQAAGTAPRRVGMLFTGSPANLEPMRAAMSQGLADLGWQEGRTIEFRYAYAMGRTERLDALAAELLGQQVDVLVVGSSAAAKAAQRATRSVPIVMTAVSDAVGNGLVTSLARPGGNVTGLTNQYEDVQGKVVELLHEALPELRRISILVNEDSPSHAALWKAARSGCDAFGLTALRVAASAPGQLPAAVEQIVAQRAQAVVVVVDAMFLNERAQLHALLQAARLPAAYGFREHVQAGGLLSYATDLTALFRYSATYVDKILRGAKPASLPVEQPTKFWLVINLRAARSLGITIPQSLLLRADEVIP